MAGVMPRVYCARFKRRSSLGGASVHTYDLSRSQRHRCSQASRENELSMAQVWMHASRGDPQRAPALESRTVHSGHHASRRKTARSRKSTSRSVCGARAVSASSARKTLTRCFKLFVSVGALPPPPDGSEHSRGMSYECWEGSGAISNLEHEFRTTHPQRY